MIRQDNNVRYNYLNQTDLIAINAALNEGADIRIRRAVNGGVKILKEKSEVIKTRLVNK